MTSSVGLMPLTGFRDTTPTGGAVAYNGASSLMLSGPDGVSRAGGGLLASVQSPTGDALGKALASVG